MKIIVLACSALFSLLFSSITNAQLNMILQDSMDYNVGVNDVCGWVAPDGSEYALVGINTGVSIVNVDDTPIHEVVFVPGVDNSWRDINTYGHYAYVSSEARVGLLIIDLQYLPDSVVTYVWKDSLPTPNGPRPFEKAHTLWTDEDGFLYLNGSNLNSGGVIMCDLKADPTDPQFLGYSAAIYSHDCYSRDSIIYSSEIYDGNLTIYDARNPANIVPIGSVHTPYEFTHNAWLTDDGQAMFTTDERGNSYVTSYDISDPANIVELDRYRQAATDGLGNVPHNVYVWNDWVVVAYYANGTVILDGSRPDNMVEVGNFDSFLGPDGGFPGVWGSYPWLPSGKILSSDRNNGLFVFVPNYVRAAFLEGFVVDSATNAPLHNAMVSILSDEIIFDELSKPDGSFKMGKAVPGQYVVKVTAIGYYDKYVTLDFVNGEVLTPTIKMQAFPTHALTGKVVYEDSGAPVPLAWVIAIGDNGVFETRADEEGNYLLPALYEGNYELQAGIWGFTIENHIVMDEAMNLQLEVVKGYVDDFDLPLGWSRNGFVQQGIWEREIPSEQLLFDNWQCGSEGDSPFDSGVYAYSTGLSTTDNVANSEVSGGRIWLNTQRMDLSNQTDLRLSFDYWLCEFPPNQYEGLFVYVTNLADTFLLEHLTNDSIYGNWEHKEYNLDFLTGTNDDVRVLFLAQDTTTGSNFYVLKAHIDNFKVTGTEIVGNDEPNIADQFVVYPNPLTGDKLYIRSLENAVASTYDITITDIQGRNLLTATRSGSTLAQDGLHVNLAEGVYMVEWINESGERAVQKLMVVKP
jgi:choice-of-anchor B domain-containing protein